MKMTKFQQAKSKLLLQQAFFATLIMSTAIEESESIPTAATDMVKIMYNPVWIDTLQIEQVMTVLGHEVLHIVFKHGLRRHDKNPVLWNIACDFAINLILVDAGFAKIDGMCFDEKFRGMSAEEIYEKLKRDGEGKGPKRKGQSGDGDQNGQGGGGDPFDGDVLEPGAMGADERAKLEQGIQQKVAQAANMARLAGKLPGSLERLVNEILNPTVPWQDLLRDYMTRITHDDESWMRRNRRFGHVYLPSRWSQGMGKLVIIGDTSGSISAEELTRVATETSAIAEAVKPEQIIVLWADTETRKVEEFEPGDAIAMHPLGGGGTDMCVPLADAEQYDPMVVVLVTDGYTPWPKVPPSYPLIVCCTTKADVPVGDVVRI